MLRLHGVFIIASLVCLVLAVPAPPASLDVEKRWDFKGPGSWGPRPYAPSFLDFTRRQSDDSGLSSCDLNNANMPSVSPALPGPAAGLVLAHVAIGRGTQNYTCDLKNSSAVPVAVGAVATLYNVSCIAADSPQLLERLPGVALNLPIPASTDPNNPANTDLSGHHYFTDTTTPFFNLDTTLHSYGTGAFKKTNASAAPSGSSVGQYGKGDGAVPWLKLDAKDASGQIFQEVYRLNTAGGQPPKTCTGASAAFEVEYAAEYWLWAK